MGRNALRRAWRRKVSKIPINGRALWIPRAASTFDHLIFRVSRSAPLRCGEFGAWAFFASVAIKRAFLQADGFDRDVFLHAPGEWAPSRRGRAWKLKAPPYGLRDAPAAFRRLLKRHLLNAEACPKCARLRCQATAFDPFLFLVFRTDGSAVGAFASHIDDISGCGEADVLAKIRAAPEQRFGELKLQESS